MFHAGLTSQDLVDTAMMMTASAALNSLEDDLTDIVSSLARLAERYAETVCVTRTLTRYAEPSLLGFRFATWLNAPRRDSAGGAHPPPVRLPVPGLGEKGAQLAKSGDPSRLVDQVATALGLSSPRAVWHTNRQPILTVTHALAVASAALGVIAPQPRGTGPPGSR